MKHEIIAYQDCINLGFKRTDLHDPLFIDDYGFDWFSVEKRVTKQLYFDWDCNSRLVTLVRGGEKTVKAMIRIYNIKHLQEMLSFFENNTGNTLPELETDYCFCTMV